MNGSDPKPNPQGAHGTTRRLSPTCTSYETVCRPSRMKYPTGTPCGRSPEITGQENGIPRSAHCPRKTDKPTRARHKPNPRDDRIPPVIPRRHRSRVLDRNGLRDLRHNPEDGANHPPAALPAASRNSGSQKVHTRPRTGTDRDEHPVGGRHRCPERRAHRHCLWRHCRR